MSQGMICNKCGKKIQKMEDHLTVEKEWGFFSKKDLEIHRWSLCEECYDWLCQQFHIPVEKEEVIEI